MSKHEHFGMTSSFGITTNRRYGALPRPRPCTRPSPSLVGGGSETPPLEWASLPLDLGSAGGSETPPLEWASLPSDLGSAGAPSATPAGGGRTTLSTPPGAAISPISQSLQFSAGAERKKGGLRGTLLRLAHLPLPAAVDHHPAAPAAGPPLAAPPRHPLHSHRGHPVGQPELRPGGRPPPTPPGQPGRSVRCCAATPDQPKPEYLALYLTFCFVESVAGAHGRPLRLWTPPRSARAPRVDRDRSSGEKRERSDR
eukprot:1189935-Prorocentrum_minimum.AAC.3